MTLQDVSSGLFSGKRNKLWSWGLTQAQRLITPPTWLVFHWHRTRRSGELVESAAHEGQREKFHLFGKYCDNMQHVRQQCS